MRIRVPSRQNPCQPFGRACRRCAGRSSGCGPPAWCTPRSRTSPTPSWRPRNERRGLLGSCTLFRESTQGLLDVSLPFPILQNGGFYALRVPHQWDLIVARCGHGFCIWRSGPRHRERRCDGGRLRPPGPPRGGARPRPEGGGRPSGTSSR